MHKEKIILTGGQRGGGKMLHLELENARLKDELKEARAERDRFAGEIARVCQSDDKIRQQMVIRIDYYALVDPHVAIDAVCRELQKIMKP